MTAWQKVKNVRHDPRVALSMLAPGKNPMGLLQYLVVYGKARITEGGGGGTPPAAGARGAPRSGELENFRVDADCNFALVPFDFAQGRLRQAQDER